MKRMAMIALTLAILFLSAYSENKILAPMAPSTSKVPASSVYTVEGTISMIINTRNNLEIVYLKGKGKLIEITVNANTRIIGNTGKKIAHSMLERGEKVVIDYKMRGKYDFARGVKVEA